MFSKFSVYNYQGWVVLESECALKHAEVGTKEGAKFISDYIIKVTDKDFGDFAASGIDKEVN